MKAFFFNLLWRLGVPLQCRAKYEDDNSWHDMVPSGPLLWNGWHSSVSTRWNFANWNYRIRPRGFDERFKCALVLLSFALLSGCAQSDTAFRSRVQSVGVNANGNVESGDYGGSVVLTLRDPRNGFSK